jgi:ABC-type Na+ efflux pump permease subunit
LSIGTEYLLIMLMLIFTGLTVLVDSLRVSLQLSGVVAFVLLIAFGAMHLVIAFPIFTKLLAVVTLTLGVCAVVYIWLGKVTGWDIHRPFK